MHSRDSVNNYSAYTSVIAMKCTLTASFTHHLQDNYTVYGTTCQAIQEIDKLLLHIPTFKPHGGAIWQLTLKQNTHCNCFNEMRLESLRPRDGSTYLTVGYNLLVCFSFWLRVLD